MGEQSLDPRQETSYGSLNLLLQNIKDFVAPSAPRGDPDISQPKATPSDAGATTSPLASAESIKLEQKWRLFERRLDYGLKFFDHHAKQRMMMFYYFLVFVGFIFASFGALAKDGDFGVATLLAVLGAFLTSFFLPLERRNEELVHIAEDLLLQLEKDVLFDEFDKEMLWPHRRGEWRGERFIESWWPLSAMNKDRAEKPSGIFRRQAAEAETNQATETGGKKCEKSKYEHGWWLPAFQLAVLATFVILALVSMYNVLYPLASSAAPVPPVPRPAITVPVFVTAPAPQGPNACTTTKTHGSGTHKNGTKAGPCK